MDHLKEVLGKCVTSTCQQTLSFRSALHYDALIGITVDEVTTLVFNLTGSTGNATSSMVAWSRRPVTESDLLKTSMEAALSDLCWDKVADVTSILVQGTICVVIDNNEVLLLQLDKVSFEPVSKPVTLEVVPEPAAQPVSETLTETDNLMSVAEPVTVETHVVAIPDDVSVDMTPVSVHMTPVGVDMTPVSVSMTPVSVETLPETVEQKMVSLLDIPSQPEMVTMETEQTQIVSTATEKPQVVTTVTDMPLETTETAKRIAQVIDDVSLTTVDGVQMATFEPIGLTQGQGSQEVLVVMVPEETDEGLLAKKINLESGEFVEETWENQTRDENMDQEADFEEAGISNSEQAALMLSQLAMTAQANELVQPKTESPVEKKSRGTTLTCYCGVEFRSRVKLNEHMRIHHSTDVTFQNMRCEFCNRLFSSLKARQNHCCRHKCDLCEFVATNKMQLKSHVIRQHETPHRDESQPLACTICQKKFKTYQRFREHKQFHTVDSLSNMSLRKLLDMDGQRLKGAVSCVLCDKNFELSYHLKTHIKKSHAIQGHLDAYNIIRQCQGIVLTPIKLRTLLCGGIKTLSSMALSLVAKPCTKTGSEFNCLLCDRKRLTKFHVIRHLEMHLKAQIEGQSGTLRLCVQRNYPCYQCYRKFKSEHTLSLHVVKEHSNGQNGRKLNPDIKLECEICGRVFKNTANIQRHMDIHRIRDTTGKKWKTAVPFQCKQCSKCYATEEKLRSHIEEFHTEKQVEELIQISKSDEVKVEFEGVVKVEGPSETRMRTRSAIKINPTSQEDQEEEINIYKEEVQDENKRKKRDKEMCPECGMTLSTKCGLTMHRVRWHGLEPPNKKAKWLQRPERQKAICEDCGKVLMSRSSIPRHRKICPGNRERLKVK